MKTVKYLNHLYANWTTAFRALLLFFFHFVHGLVPIKYTSHEYWGVRLNAEGFTGE